MQVNTRAIIIDDEQHAIDSLLVLLEDFPELIIENTFTSSAKALAFVLKNKPDLVFIDIRMPELSGIDFAHKLIDLKVNIPLVFTTAFNEYVLEALRNNAVDYLLKPVSYTGLKEAVERFKRRTKNDTIENVKRFIKASQRRNLRFNTRNGFITFFEDEILFINADGVYSKFQLKNGKEVTVSQNLGKIEEQLQMPGLIKIHRSVIVNANYIFEVTRGKKECTLSLDSSNFKLPVSAEGVKKIEEFIFGKGYSP